MTICRYKKEDEEELFNLLRSEGVAWNVYFLGEGMARFRAALKNSLTYVVYEDGELCGFCRCHDDFGFGIYVFDLLVAKKHRGKNFGLLLVGQVCIDFPDARVYVMSDEDGYYEKQGYQREGSVFSISLME